MTEIIDFLKQVDLFGGLSEAMMVKIAQICQPKTYPAGSIIIERNSPPKNFYLIVEGTVKILTAPEGQERNFSEAAVITLGWGQSFGEMGLIDSGPRSATVKSATDTLLYVFDCKQFRELCETDTMLGYRVMRNIAADLSFKLRYRNLI